jgi:LacI family transcriptional regulator
MAAMESKRVTLREIADTLGISRMTVSLALRDDPRVAAATKKEVQAAAKRLNYAPNAQVSKLMAELAKMRVGSKNSEELAFLTSFDTENGWQDDNHIRSCYQGARERAEQLGYTLTPYWVFNPDWNQKRLSEILWARGISGVMVAPLGSRFFEEPVSKLELHWDKFCWMQIGATLTEPMLHLVRHNHFDGMTKALDQLSRKGYRSIGLALSPIADEQSYHRWAAAYFYWQSHQSNTPLHPPFIFDQKELSQHLFQKWLEKGEIDAVIGMEPQLLEALDELSIHVPKQIGFCLLDHPDGSDTISGIYQNAEQIGRFATESLIEKIHYGERGLPTLAKEILVSGNWVSGKTTQKKRLQKKLLEP